MRKQALAGGLWEELPPCGGAPPRGLDPAPRGQASVWFQYDAARSKGLVFLDIAHGFHEPWTVEHDDPGAAPISVRQSEVHEDD